MIPMSIMIIFVHNETRPFGYFIRQSFSHHFLPIKGDQGIISLESLITAKIFRCDIVAKKMTNFV